MPKYPPHPLLQQPLEDMLKGDYLEPEDYTTSNKLIDVRIVIRIMEAMLVLKKDWPDKFAFFDPMPGSLDSIYLKWYYQGVEIDSPRDQRMHKAGRLKVNFLVALITTSHILHRIWNSIPFDLPKYRATDSQNRIQANRLLLARISRLEDAEKLDVEDAEYSTSSWPDREVALLHFLKAARALEIKLQAKTRDGWLTAPSHQAAHLFHQVVYSKAPCNSRNTPPCSVKISICDAIKIVGTLANEIPSEDMLEFNDQQLVSLSEKFQKRALDYPVLRMIYQPIYEVVNWLDFDSDKSRNLDRYGSGTLGSVLKKSHHRPREESPGFEALHNYPTKLFATLYGPGHEQFSLCSQEPVAKIPAPLKIEIGYRTPLHVIALSEVDDEFGKTNIENSEDKRKGKINGPRNLDNAELISPSERFRSLWHLYSQGERVERSKTRSVRDHILGGLLNMAD